MKTHKAIKEPLLGFIVIAPLVYYLFLWSSLPEIIPVHFDGNGNPDKYGSRNYIAITVFFLTVGIYLILKYIPKIDPKNNFTLFSKTYYKLRLILSLFFSILGFIIIASAQQGRVSVSILYITIAFLISIMGNYLGTIRPNYYLGIRTPWTLKNESIWREVHYFSGKLWFFSGIFLGLLMIFLPAHFRTPVFVAVVLLLAGIPSLYSYGIYLKINKQKIMKNSSDKHIMNSDRENSEGWKGIIYFNRQDSRLIVPKRFPGMGWTLNFAHSYTYILLIALALLIFLLNHFVQ